MRVHALRLVAFAENFFKSHNFQIDYRVQNFRCSFIAMKLFCENYYRCSDNVFNLVYYTNVEEFSVIQK